MLTVKALVAMLLTIVVLWAQPCLASPPASATLSEMFILAQDNEPHYLGTKANLAAARAHKREALGALLPHLSATANRKFHHRKYKTLGVPLPSTRNQFVGEGAHIQLKQPIWNYADILALQEARKKTQRSQLLTVVAKQQLFVKVANAWFDLLEAHDAATVARARQATLRAKAKTAEHGSHLGLRGAPQAAHARAKYLEAEADVEAAETEQKAKLAALEQFVGPIDHIVLPQLGAGSDIPDIIGNNLSTLLATAVSANPKLQAAHRKLAAANTDVSRQRAARQPTLSLVASYGNTNQGVGNFPGQSGYKIHDYYVGLKLNVPIYAGGTESAKIQGSIANRDKAREDLHATRRKVQFHVRTAYFSWHANRARAKAAAVAMNANQDLLKQARMGMQRGLQTHADVLEARQHWIKALADWHKACYEQLRAYIKLRAALGDLTTADAMDIDRLFSPGHPSVSVLDNSSATREAPES